VAKITGVSRKRIAGRLKDLAAPPLDPGCVRRKGGGRRPITETDGTIVEDLKHLVEPVTMWKIELQKLADELQMPIKVCRYPPGTSKWRSSTVFSATSRKTSAAGHWRVCMQRVCRTASHWRMNPSREAGPNK
jgi:hypothetical protein